MNTLSLIEMYKRADPFIFKEELCNQGNVKKFGNCVIIIGDRTWKEMIIKAYNRTEKE